MSYQEYKPHEALRLYIDAYWRVQTTLLSKPSVSRILPDGCVDIIINTGSTVVASDEDTLLVPEQAYLIGTMTSFSDTTQQPGAMLTGIRFKPAAFTLFYHTSLAETADTCTSFELPLPVEQLRQADFVTRLDQYFLRRKQTARHRLFPVIDNVLQCAGNVRISQLAREHFTTKRQLERSFKEQLGISPKEFANIVRYRSVLKTIRHNAGKRSLEEIAFLNGYYDHAHLTNEIKRYTGNTPGAF
ncbi:AraC family transcriptional regulator [Paraflavitalea soli]|uniref:AraC family transcriptional regulator n=1 Tax=Paraflavitalea soli TaxID=2315862 RepID=A0A3B7MJY4_9BACT|nr:helix-turn-helix transcriptional regulator [Paraflavitalea soli]AXY73336.1 AraC family transcriptional regulator [Paraflavitalea soli]